MFEEVLKSKSIIPDLLKAANNVEESNLEDLLFSLAKKFYFTLLSKKKFILITFSEINQYSGKIINIHEKLIDKIDELFIKIFKNYKVDNSDIGLKRVAMAFRGMVFDFFFTNEIFLRKNISREEIENTLLSFVKIILSSLYKIKNIE